jgi:tRNA nucleotidyltransferase (CCA-adding enzyme)
MYTLTQYVDDVLKPQPSQLSVIPSKINRITNVIKNGSALSLNMVVPGGSYKKGIMLRYKPDIDLVLVFNKEPKVKRNWKALMKKVYTDLSNAFPKDEIDLGDNIAIHLNFNNQNEKLNFDIVPSYSVNSPLQMTGVKNSKIYQGITTIWHIEYWKQKKSIPLITETVRLLKNWKNEQKINLKSFHMELIAASAYEYRLEDNYNLEEFFISCLKEIQGMLDGTPVFPVNWEYFYREKYDDHYEFPVLIDPADPSENLVKYLVENDIKKIKSKTTKAIKDIQNGFYGLVFDPENKTRCFV